MKNKSIEMISYSKISYLSDAFVVSEDLEPYIDLVTNDNYSAGKISLDKYTAGSTDNPDSYKLPDHENLYQIRSLSEINPFKSNKNQSIFLRSNQDHLNEYSFLKDEEEKFNDQNDFLYSPDAQDILKVLEQNFFQLSSNKKYDHSKLELSSKIYKYVLFELNERYFSSSSESDLTKSNDFEFPKNSTNKQEVNKIDYKVDNTKVENIYDTNITELELQNISSNENINVKNENTNIYEGKNIKYKSNVENRYKSVRYSIQNITKNYITEIKQEIVQQVEQMITVLETKIKNESISKIEINNIKNEIINNFETKIESHTKKALEQFETKSKAEIKGMFKTFLNS